MMGRLKSDQAQLFYEFRLGDAVLEDHLVRKIDAALDLCWLRSELAPYYSSTGRPSIDPELMIRMLVVGYVFAIRSERLIILAGWTRFFHRARRTRHTLPERLRAAVVHLLCRGLCTCRSPAGCWASRVNSCSSMALSKVSDAQN